MKLNKLNVFIAALTVGYVLVSCKKNDQVYQNDQAGNASIQFFASHQSSNSLVQAVAGFVKREDDKYHFGKNLEEKIGYPYWDKAIVSRKLVSTFSGNDSADIVIVPFVRENEKFVNAALAVETTPLDTNFKFVSDWQYKQATHGSATDENTAESIAMFFMIMNKKVFNTSGHRLTDPQLFHSSIPTQLGRDRDVVIMDSAGTGNINSLYVSQTYTVAINSFHCATPSYCKSNCDYANCPAQSPNKCYFISSINFDYTITIWEDGGGSGGGTGGGTGGTGGGGWNPGPIGGGGTGGGPVGWVPIVLFEPYECTYQMTPHEISIFNQLDQENAEVDFQYQNLDCQGTKRTGNINFSGTLQHWLIQLDYISKNPLFGEREFAIPHSGTSSRGYADIANLLNGNIFEIKPDDATYHLSGINEVSNYVAKANTYCTSTLPAGVVWNRGSVYPTTYLPTHLPNRYLKARLMAPGLIGYSYENTANPPNPPPIAIPASILEKLRKLIDRLKQNIADADRIISEFMQQHPEVVTFIKVMAVGAGVAIIVGTLVEDILTAGAGILDDWASFQLAYRIIRFGLAL